MSSNKWDQPKIDHIADLTLYPMTIYTIYSVFFGSLSCAGLDMPLLTFWSVTKSPLVGYQGIIPRFEEDSCLSYDPNCLNISGVVRELELEATFR